MTTFKIVTVYPDFFSSFLSSSFIARTIDRKLIDIKVIDLKDYSFSKSRRVDDSPISGGAGLILKIDPLVNCLKKTCSEKTYKVLFSPRGKRYNQRDAKRLSDKEEIIFFCGHFEGIDSRFSSYVDEEISLGDYILTGGELPAMILIDSITRLISGAINDESIKDESFNSSLLEYDQYSYPLNYDGKKVPDILLSGNHQVIEKYHLKNSLKNTIEKRKDLLDNLFYNREIAKYYQEIVEEKEGDLEKKIDAAIKKRNSSKIKK